MVGYTPHTPGQRVGNELAPPASATLGVVDGETTTTANLRKASGLFSGNFVMPVSQVWITFGWAMAWMASRGGVEPAPPVAGRTRFTARRIAALGLLLPQLWLVWNVWPEVRQFDEHVQQAMERVPNATMNPRFGLHGWF